MIRMVGVCGEELCAGPVTADSAPVLADDRNLYAAVLDTVKEGIYFVDRDYKIYYWNRGAEHITGYAKEQTLGRACSDNLLMHCSADGRLLCRGGCPLGRTLDDGCERTAEVILRHKEGYRVPVHIRIAPVRNRAGRITGAMEVFSDASARLAVIEHAREMKDDLGFLDPLTGLCNRRAIEQRLREIPVCPFEARSRTALLVLDIDQFKHVNESFGHEAGDAVLRTVSGTLVRTLRSYDFIGRLGGDEFMIVLANADAERAWTVAERCRVLVECSPVPVHGRSLPVTCSIGLTMLQPGDDPASFLRRAGALLVESRRRGCNTVAY